MEDFISLTQGHFISLVFEHFGLFLLALSLEAVV